MAHKRTDRGDPPPDDPDAIRAAMAETRAALTEKLDALRERVLGPGTPAPNQGEQVMAVKKKAGGAAKKGKGARRPRSRPRPRRPPPRAGPPGRPAVRPAASRPGRRRRSPAPPAPGRPGARPSRPPSPRRPRPASRPESPPARGSPRRPRRSWATSWSGRRPGRSRGQPRRWCRRPRPWPRQPTRRPPAVRAATGTRRAARAPGWVPAADRRRSERAVGPASLDWFTNWGRPVGRPRSYRRSSLLRPQFLHFLPHLPVRLLVERRAAGRVLARAGGPSPASAPCSS